MTKQHLSSIGQWFAKNNMFLTLLLPFFCGLISYIYIDGKREQEKALLRIEQCVKDMDQTMNDKLNSHNTRIISNKEAVNKLDKRLIRLEERHGINIDLSYIPMDFNKDIR